MAKEDSASTEVETLRPYQKLQNQLAARVGLDATNGSNFDIAAQVIDLIMTAGTEDEIFAANESGPLDITDYLGTPINIWQLTFFRSAEKYRANSLGFYVVMDAFDDTGAEIKLSTGAPNVVSSMKRLEELGLIKEEKPYRVKITGRETGNGTLYYLARA